MHIMIVGGRKKADFLLSSLLEKNHKVTLIHDNEDFCRAMSKKHNATIVHGNGSKPYILEDANIGQMDIVIAMTPYDPTNLAICQLAKKIYGVNKVFSSVNNPGNVEPFKKLGVDMAISSTYIISKLIGQMVTVEEISELIPISEGKVVMMEIVVKESFPIANKTLIEANIPESAVVGCIVRGINTIIPGGKTKILEKDKLIILSSPKIQDEVIKRIVGR